MITLFIGVLNGGMGNTHLNKLLSAMNIPELEYFHMRQKLGELLKRWLEIAAQQRQGIANAELIVNTIYIVNRYS